MGQYKVVVNPNQCIDQQVISFLGYLVSKKGIRPLTAKVKAIQSYQSYEATQRILEHFKFEQKVVTRIGSNAVYRAFGTWHFQKGTGIGNVAYVSKTLQLT